MELKDSISRLVSLIAERYEMLKALVVYMDRALSAICSEVWNEVSSKYDIHGLYFSDNICINEVCLSIIIKDDKMECDVVRIMDRGPSAEEDMPAISVIGRIRDRSLAYLALRLDRFINKINHLASKISKDNEVLSKRIDEALKKLKPIVTIHELTK